MKNGRERRRVRPAVFLPGRTGMQAGKQRGARVGFLDEWRGVTILLMVFYHGAYDLEYVFGAGFPGFRGPAMDALQLYICCSFIFVAGICCRYSRGNLRRGAMVLAVALAMTLVTALLMPQQKILFGVLHFLGCAMMLYALLGQLSDKLPAGAGFAAMLLLWAFTFNIAGGSVGFFRLLRLYLPGALYTQSFLFPLGLPGPGFFSSDYFPVIPWIFLFFAGSYAGVWFRAGKMPAALYRTHLPLFAAVGRRSLLIYVLHQPVLYAVLGLACGAFF